MLDRLKALYRSAYTVWWHAHPAIVGAVTVALSFVLWREHKLDLGEALTMLLGGLTGAGVLQGQKSATTSRAVTNLTSPAVPDGAPRPMPDQVAQAAVLKKNGLPKPPAVPAVVVAPPTPIPIPPPPIAPEKIEAAVKQAAAAPGQNLPQKIVETVSKLLPDRVSSAVWIDLRTEALDKGTAVQVWQHDKLSADALLGMKSAGLALGYQAATIGPIIATVLAGAAHPYSGVLTSGWSPVVGASFKF